MMARAGADDWPTVRHDSGNTGLSADSLAPPYVLDWRVKVRESAVPVLLGSGGFVCVGLRAPGSLKPEIRLYDSRGHLLRRMPGMLPAYFHDGLLVVSVGGEMRAYRQDSETPLWSLPNAGAPADLRGAIARDGLLYCLYTGWQSPLKLYVIRLSDGAVVSKLERDWSWGFGPPALDGDALYVGTAHWLQVLDRGSLLPRWAWYDGGNCWPMVANGRLAAQGPMHRAGIYDPAMMKTIGGTHAWRGAAHGIARGPSGQWVLAKSRTDPQELIGLDLAKGEELWRQPIWVGGYALDNYTSMAAGTDHWILVPGWHTAERDFRIAKGGFYAFDAKTGRQAWSSERPKMKGLAVIISDGAVYGFGSDGYLYKFRSKLLRKNSVIVMKR